MGTAARVLSLPDKLYNVIPKSWAGAAVRGVRVAVGLIMATVIATVSDGSVFREIHLIGADQVPIAIAVLTPLITALDKKLRDAGLEETPPTLPTSEAVGDPQDVTTP